VRLALASGLALSLALGGACASDERSPVRATASGSLIILPGEQATVHGQPVYTDRTYTFEGLGALAGLRYLPTANDDKTFVARNFLELEAGSGTAIYLALDRRELSVPVPSWLADEGFQPLSAPDAARFRVVTSDREARFEVYVRKARGKRNLLTLGGNVDQPMPPTASLSMYLVFYRGELAPPAPGDVVRQRIEEGAAPRAPGEPLGGAAAAGGREAYCHAGQPLPGPRQVLLWSESLPRKRADFRCAQLSGLDLSASSVDFSGADLIAADLRAANLSTAVLDGAEMEYANLAKARLRQASLQRANLVRADLTGAKLNGADLSNANLSGAQLEGADLTAANLKDVLFEPDSLPATREIAFASGLEWLRYRDYPDALIRLRDSFKKDGFRQQERLVTAAIERQKLARSPWYERWTRVVLLGLTCDYGSAVTRPLLLIVVSILIFPLLYYPCGRWLTGCKLQLVDADDRSAAPRDVPDSKRWRYCFQLSLVSAFAPGGPLDVGKWIERLLPTTISVHAKGGLRTLTGIQSLMGLALLTLWLLNFLGRPFE
jgi:Pentapeptide repeats (8 copies)